MILPLQVVHHRADEWPMPPVARIQLHRDVDSRRPRRGVRDAVNRIGMRHRANDRNPVGHLRHMRQKLAHVAARQPRADRPQLAPNFERGVGLHVGQLELAGRAIEVQQNARLCPPETAWPGFVRFGLNLREAQVVAEPDTEQTQAPGDEHLAAGYAVAQPFWRTENLQHRRVSCQECSMR